MAKRRITLSLDEDLVARFQAAADLERRSLSSCVEGWLEQVVPAAEWVASLADSQRGQGLEQVRLMVDAMIELQQETAQALMRARGKGGAGKRAPHAPPDTPPACNTGGKFANGAGRGRH